MVLKLNKENYFSMEADKEYLSVSQYKSFLDCEAKTLAKINGEYNQSDKKAFLQGKMFHAWVEGTLSDFMDKESENIMKKRGSGLLSEYVLVEKIINQLENNPKQYKRLLNIIQHKKNQHEQIFTANLFGVKWKCMMDIYNPESGWFADMKLVKGLYDKFYNTTVGKYENFIKHYKYDLQMIMYAEIERVAVNRDDILKPILATVTKEEPSDTKIFVNFEENRKDVLDFVELDIDRFVGIKNKEIKPDMCEKCDYCRSVKETTIMKYDKLFI